MYTTILTGYIRNKGGADPEMRYTANGTPVTSFTVPAKVGFGDNEKDLWIRCTAWGKQAQTIAQYFKSGDYIEMQGTIEAKAYKNRDGEAVGSLEFTVREFKFGPKGKNHQDGDAPAPAKASGNGSSAASNQAYDEGDLPF